MTGVSIATVSNALNDKGRISDRVRQRILNVCRKHGYQPNSAARNLRRRGNESIGVLFYPSCAAAFKNVFYADILGSLSKALERARFNLLLPGFDGSSLTEELPRFVCQKVVDGVVLLGEFPHRVVRNIHGYGIPTVLIDNYRASLEVDSVTTDGFTASRQIVDHLVNLGHRNIAFMAYEQDGYNADQRQAGFADGIQAHKLPSTRCPILRNFTETIGAFESLQYEMKKGHAPTAVIMVNDTLASEMQVCLKNEGFKIPQDISIFGFDDHSLSKHQVPPISTVRVDRDKIAEAGASLILKRVQDCDRSVENIVLPVELVHRESVAAPNF